jgi:hypothetical protein
MAEVITTAVNPTFTILFIVTTFRLKMTVFPIDCENLAA